MEAKIFFIDKNGRMISSPTIENEILCLLVKSFILIFLVKHYFRVKISSFGE